MAFWRDFFQKETFFGDFVTFFGGKEGLGFQYKIMHCFSNLECVFTNQLFWIAEKRDALSSQMDHLA